jgi:LysR family transcriptional regulator for bpeEF and oprC
LGYAKTKPVGKLRVAASSAVGRAALIPNLAEFEAKFPDIRLELTMCDFPFDLNEEGFDCAIRMGELADSSLIARKIGHFSNVLCASPAYLAKHGVPTTIEDLKTHRTVNFVHPSTGKPSQWQFDSPSGRVAVDVDAHMMINDGESVIQAAIAGLGVIQAPHCLAASALDKGLLEIIMTDTISTGSNLWIVYPQKRHLSARVQAFIEWTSELFQRTSTPQCQIVQQQMAELERRRNGEPARIAAVA